MPNSLKLGKNNHEPSEIITYFPLVQDMSLFLAFSLETSHLHKEHLCSKLIPESAIKTAKIYYCIYGIFLVNAPTYLCRNPFKT